MTFVVGRHAVGGERYIGPGLFTGVSAIFFGYLLCVWVMDGLATLNSGRSG